MEIPTRITREWLKAHPEVAVIYGTTALGYFPVAGSAEAELCCCDNAFGVPVKHKFCPSDGYWFTDDCFSLWKPSIDKTIVEIFEKTENDFEFELIIYIPHIGLGPSCLKKYGPKTYEYLISELDKICHNKELKLK